MKIILFTSNAIRHRFVANTLAEAADDTLVVCECKPSDAAPGDARLLSRIEAHFRARFETEQRFFSGHHAFAPKTLPLIRGEANTPYACDVVRAFAPDMMFAFGSSILKEPLLSLLPPGRFVNLHLGLSPYYRGSGTNFWPFVNEELDYLGATLLHIDAGVDTGDIAAHLRPTVEPDDDVHSVGCRIIRDGAAAMVRSMALVRAGRALPRVEQWEVRNARYYRKRDFDEDVLRRYLQNLENGLVQRYLAGPKKRLRLVELAHER